MSDTFTKDRLAWLDQLVLYQNVSARSFLLAYCLSGYVNRKTRDAWPSLDTLAKSLGANERTIRRWMEELTALGYLGKTRGGNGHSNRYRMLFPDRAQLPHHPSNRLDSKRCPDWTSDGTPSGTKCPPNSLSEPSEKRSISPVADAEFAEIWQHYPRKVSRGQAEKAFRTTRKTVDLETVRAGVLRYAAERSGEEPRFTKHFATWLNGQCWADEAAPFTPATTPSCRAGAKTRAGEISRQLIADAEEMQGQPRFLLEKPMS